MAKNVFEPLKSEKVLIEAKVGKRIVRFYLFLQLIVGIVATGIFLPGVIWYAKIPNGYYLLIVGAALYAVILFLVGHYLSVKNRLYVLTDKRVVIIKGGKTKRANRSLVLKSIQGLQKNNNCIYDRFGLATIDFYALAVASTTTKFKLISFSSTDFKFQWVDRQDADKVSMLMKEYLVDGKFGEELIAVDNAPDRGEGAMD